jgi:hypothetical protein
MSMIDRYRKKGGFIQLLNLIETSPKDKQEKFLNLIRQESPAWEQEVRKKILSVDKFLAWNPTYIAEILPRIPVMQIAMFAGGLPEDKKTQFIQSLGFKERKQVEDFLSEKTPSPAEFSTAVMKVFAEVRKMVQEGSLKFEKFDPEMVVPENIEELLGKGRAGLGTREHELLSPQMGHPTGSAPLIDAAQSSASAGIPSNVSEELSQLRRKLVSMTQDLQKLQVENQVMREKLDQIKKIA